MSDPVQLRSRTIRGARGDGPRVLVTAGVHGDELEPMAAVRRLAGEIDPAKLRGRLTLIPVVNEPAFARDSRVAEDGLDLARTCPGRRDGSITERVAAALAEHIRDCDYFVDLHTGGRSLRLAPLAGYMLHERRDVLDRQRSMAAAFGLPLVWGTSPRLDGRSLSVARDHDVPAIYVEYGGGGMFEPHVVDAYVAGCLGVLAAIGSYDDVRPLKSPPRVVEDPRDQSGVLQVQHPAPAAGFFEPLAELGQDVRAGQPIGRVFDVLGEGLGEVRAAETGVLVMLRAWRHVNAGDALAAVACTSIGGAS
jgi:predicted deacylase